MEVILFAQAKKTLIMDDGQVSFIKGKIYPVLTPHCISLTEKTWLEDEQKEEHCLSTWKKHFKPILKP